MVGWCHALRNCRDNDDKEVAVNGLLGTPPFTFPPFTFFLVPSTCIQCGGEKM